MNFDKMDKLAQERDELLELYPEDAPFIWQHYIEMIQKYLNLL